MPIIRAAYLSHYSQNLCNSTLSAHLRTWKTNQRQTQQVASERNIPEALVATLKGLWDQVMDNAEDKIQSIEHETKQDVIKLTRELKEVQQELARWKQEQQLLKQEKDGIAHEKSTLEQLLGNARIEMASFTEKHAGLEHQNQEKQTRIDELRQQNSQMQANLEHYRAASLEQRLVDQQRYEQQLKQMEQTIVHLNQELTQIKHENSAFQQQAQENNFERNSLKTQLDKLDEQHQAMTERLAKSLNDLAKKSQAQEHWQEQYDTLLAKWDELNKSFLELQTQHALSVQEIVALRAELKETAEQSKVLAHEKWILGQEKAQLYGQLKQIQEMRGIKESY